MACTACNDVCNCAVVAGIATVVTGTGSGTDPYVIDSVPVLPDCEDFQDCVAPMLDTVGFVYVDGPVIGGGGNWASQAAAPGTVLTNDGAAGATWLPVINDCEEVQDCVGTMLNGVGFVYDDVGNQFDSVVAAPGTLLTNDGVGGASWIAPAPVGGLTVSDTSTVDHTLAGINLSSAVRISAAPCNSIGVNADGLHHRECFSGIADVSGGNVGNTQLTVATVVNNPSLCRPVNLDVTFVNQWSYQSLIAAINTVNTGGFPINNGFGYIWNIGGGVYDLRINGNPLQTPNGGVGMLYDNIITNTGVRTIPPGGSLTFQNDGFNFDQVFTKAAGAHAASIRVLWVTG